MVKRYEFKQTSGWDINCEMVEDDEGSFVDHSDYAALQHKLELARDSYETALRGYCEKSDGSCPVSGIERENEVLREALEDIKKAGTTYIEITIGDE